MARLKGSKERKSLLKRYKVSTNAVKTGKYSKQFLAWLKKHGLELPDIPEDEDWIKEMERRVLWMEVKNRELRFWASYYKDLGARGLSMFDELIELEGQIIEREQRLRKEGKDPLEDEPLQKAKQRKFEIIKFLQRIKWDRDKFMIEQSVKDLNKQSKKDLFTVETDYEVLIDDQDTRSKVEGSES